MSEASEWGPDIGAGLKAVADDLDVRGNEYSAKGIRLAIARIAELEQENTELRQQLRSAPWMQAT